MWGDSDEIRLRKLFTTKTNRIYHFQFSDWLEFYIN